MPGKKKSAKKKAVKKSVKKRMGGGMMGPKKKMARGGAVKKRGGGMMGPKKKLAKGGSLRKLLKDPPGRLKDDINPSKRAMPTGRSAAAKKAAMKGVSTGVSKLMAKIRKGKGNPAGKDLSMKGRLTALMRAAPATGGIRRLMKRGAPKKGKK